MPFKITLLFQQTTGVGATLSVGNHIGGWSESVYSNESDIQVVRNKLFTAGAWGIGLCPARAALLSQFGAIVGQRIAQVLPRVGRSQTSGNNFPGGSLPTDVPQMALQCSMPAVGAVNVRHFSLRGVPDSQVVLGEFTPSLAYAFAGQTLFTEYQNWRFLGQDLTLPFYDVASIDAAGLVTLNVVIPFLLGDQVQFQGLTSDDSGEKFTHRGFVASIGPGPLNFSIRDYRAPAAHGGRVRKVAFQTFLMAPGGSVDRVAVRKVGRPFGQYRGRRSKRRLVA